MYYQLNKETQKIELITGREDYAALSAEEKSNIKRAFLFSRSLGGWVSRAKYPNTYYAEQIAQKIGAENRGKIGEALTFAEKMERKTERAEARAERYEGHAEAAEKRGEKLQEPIENMRGDIAFFTQPNINTSAGRAFTRRREKMFAAYEKGFDEFRKSEYWQERAETARRTAEKSELKDKGFVQRRIAERESSIRKVGKREREYENYLEAVERGDIPHDEHGWEIKLTKEQIQRQIDADMERLEVLLDELGYYQDILEKLGGVQFSKSNLKKGDLLFIGRWKEPVRFVRGGSKNFTYEFTVPHMTYADGSPMIGQAAYAEIERLA